MLTRQEYVEHCTICQKRQFDMKKGLCCSLTSEHAAFEDAVCPDREIDLIAEKKWITAQRHKEEDLIEAKTFGLSKIGVKNQLVAGSILVVAGFGWLVGGLAINRIFFYSIFLIIVGLVLIVKSLVDKSKSIVKPDKSSILDDDLE